MRSQPPGSLTDRASAAATSQPAHNPKFLRIEASVSCMRLLGGEPQTETGPRDGPPQGAPAPPLGLQPKRPAGARLRRIRWKAPSAVSPEPRGLTPTPSAAAIWERRRRHTKLTFSIQQFLAARPPNGPRISCGDSSTAHYPTFLRPEAPASWMRLLGCSVPRSILRLVRNRPGRSPLRHIPASRSDHCRGEIVTRR
jgi:hypothetical protein